MKSVIVKQSFTRTGQQVLEPIPDGRHSTTKRQARAALHRIPDHHDLRVMSLRSYEAHAWVETRRRQGPASRPEIRPGTGHR